MPPVPAALLDQIKQAAPMTMILESRGVALEARGSDMICCCPLPGHDDQSPSFHVTPNETGGVGHCFGCGWAGNGFQLVQGLDDCGFLAAVEKVASVGGVEFDVTKYRTVGRPKAAPASCPLDPAADGDALSAQVASFYHSRLLRSGSDGWKYLEKRGLADKALVRRFQLGMADRGALGRLLPNNRVHAGRELRQKLIGLGWYKEDSGHEAMAGRLVVPLLDADGVVGGCYGRALKPLKNGDKHRNLSGSMRTIWNAAAFAPGGAATQSRQAIICEAVFDALTFARHGRLDVTACLGCKNLKQMHIDACVAAGVHEVFLAFDADAKGEEAIAEVVPRFVAAGMTVYRVYMPPGQDVNQMAVAAGDAAGEALAQVLRDATWLGGIPTGQAVETTETAGDECAAGPVLPDDVKVQCENGNVLIESGNREYRVRGLERCTSSVSVRVVLRLRVGERFHDDHLDLSSHRARLAFEKAAAEACQVQPELIREDLGKVLLIAENQVDQRLRALASDAQPSSSPADAMSDEEREKALRELRRPDLLDVIVKALTLLGLVGEEINKQFVYLATISRLLVAPSKPLAVLVRSSSAAGKSALVEAVTKLQPKESCLQLTSISPQALSFFGRDELKRKTISIAEEEGMIEAEYLLKIMQSEGKIRRTTTTKDTTTGQPKAVTFQVDGPVQLFLTTTSDDINEELLNRCVVLSVDEDQDQTAAIHDVQRAAFTPSGYIAARENESLIRLHHNMQRLLRPMVVFNPYARQLDFPTYKTRLRREHQKYLDLINTIALLHQHQREIKELRLPDGTIVPYIEVTKADIAVANRIARVVFARTLDELAAPARRLLDACVQMVKQTAENDPSADEETIRFSRRDAVDASGMSRRQVRRHLDTLVEYEYLAEFKGGARNSSFYQLLDDGSTDEKTFPGLVDVDDLVEPDDSWMSAVG